MRLPSLFLLLSSCTQAYEVNFGMGNSPVKNFGQAAKDVITKEASQDPQGSATTETTIFAAGCFWGVDLAFQRVPGVVKTEVGYTGGSIKNPTYEQVCSGQTGHTEAVQVQFNNKVVNFEELLTVFWDRLDPTTRNRQGGDVGTQYRSGIYYTSEEQKSMAIASRGEEQKKYESPIVTEILPASEWYPAEDYHQKVSRSFLFPLFNLFTGYYFLSFLSSTHTTVLGERRTMCSGGGHKWYTLLWLIGYVELGCDYSNNC